jgi:hypothetical protein
MGPNQSIEIITAIKGAVCTYADETEMPKEHQFGSGLKLQLPNGDTLFIMERRNHE